MSDAADAFVDPVDLADERECLWTSFRSATEHVRRFTQDTLGRAKRLKRGEVVTTLSSCAYSLRAAADLFEEVEDELRREWGLDYGVHKSAVVVRCVRTCSAAVDGEGDRDVEKEVRNPTVEETEVDLRGSQNWCCPSLTENAIDLDTIQDRVLSVEVSPVSTPDQVLSVEVSPVSTPEQVLSVELSPVSMSDSVLSVELSPVSTPEQVSSAEPPSVATPVPSVLSVEPLAASTPEPEAPEPPLRDAPVPALPSKKPLGPPRPLKRLVKKVTPLAPKKPLPPLNALLTCGSLLITPGQESSEMPPPRLPPLRLRLKGINDEHQASPHQKKAKKWRVENLVETISSKSPAGPVKKRRVSRKPAKVSVTPTPSVSPSPLTPSMPENPELASISAVDQQPLSFPPVGYYESMPNLLITVRTKKQEAKGQQPSPLAKDPDTASGKANADIQESEGEAGTASKPATTMSMGSAISPSLAQPVPSAAFIHHVPAEESTSKPSTMSPRIEALEVRNEQPVFLTSTAGMHLPDVVAAGHNDEPVDAPVPVVENTTPSGNVLAANIPALSMMGPTPSPAPSDVSRKPLKKRPLRKEVAKEEECVASEKPKRQRKPRNTKPAPAVRKQQVLPPQPPPVGPTANPLVAMASMADQRIEGRFFQPWGLDQMPVMGIQQAFTVGPGPSQFPGLQQGPLQGGNQNGGPPQLPPNVTVGPGFERFNPSRGGMPNGRFPVPNSGPNAHGHNLLPPQLPPTSWYRPMNMNPQYGLPALGPSGSYPQEGAQNSAPSSEFAGLARCRPGLRQGRPQPPQSVPSPFVPPGMPSRAPRPPIERPENQDPFLLEYVERKASADRLLTNWLLITNGPPVSFVQTPDGLLPTFLCPQPAQPSTPGAGSPSTATAGTSPNGSASMGATAGAQLPDPVHHGFPV